VAQRLHEGDVSGDILSREADYCHLMIPMRFESMVHRASADGERTEDPETGEPFTGNEIGWIDPRALDENGDISPHVRWRDTMASWHGQSASTVPTTAPWSSRSETSPIQGSTQQSPVPRKGGIIKREYWQSCIVAESQAAASNARSTTTGNPITGEGLPNPTPVVTRNSGQLPAGRKWGTTAGIDVDPIDVTQDPLRTSPSFVAALTQRWRSAPSSSSECCQPHQSRRPSFRS
jgi:hypothetical protein